MLEKATLQYVRIFLRGAKQGSPFSDTESFAVQKHLRPFETENHATLMRRLLRRKEVQAITGLPTSSLYALIKKGQFPAGVKLSAKAVAWSSEAVQSWVDARIANGGAA